jgi:hypothetical protein
MSSIIRAARSPRAPVPSTDGLDTPRDLNRSMGASACGAPITACLTIERTGIGVFLASGLVLFGSKDGALIFLAVLVTAGTVTSGGGGFGALCDTVVSSSPSELDRCSCFGLRSRVAHE